MATGETTTGSLADSLPSIIASARIVREYAGVNKKTCDQKTLAPNTGLDWQEISLSQLAAQDITETTTNTNAQQLVDTLFSITPGMTQILVKITDRTMRRIARVVKAEVGPLSSNAMARKSPMRLTGVATSTFCSTPNSMSDGSACSAAL